MIYARRIIVFQTDVNNSKFAREGKTYTILIKKGRMRCSYAAIGDLYYQVADMEDESNTTKKVEFT